LRRSSPSGSGPLTHLTLASIDQRLQAVVEWARKVSDRRGIKLTPEALATEIDRAGANARRADAQALAQARSGLEDAIHSINVVVAQSRSSAEQKVWLIRSGATLLIIGLVLGAIIASSV
jgi:hypothetical protein